MNKDNFNIICRDVRKSMLKISNRSFSSHIGGSLSIVELLVYLYHKQMNINKENFNDKIRDYFILSKGHSSLALYTVLNSIDIISDQELNAFYSNGSNLIGHVNHKVDGVDVSTGSLGHGLSIGIGIALSFKLKKINQKVYVILGDGECDEGSIWEAFRFISQHNINNIIPIIDANNLQGYPLKNHSTKLEDTKNMLKSLNIYLHEINGHSFDELEKTFQKISLKNDKPSVLYANTIKGKGISFMENDLLWHYRSLCDDELKIALDELDNKNNII